MGVNFLMLKIIMIKSSDAIDDTVYLWERLFCEVADEHVPVKKRRVKVSNPLG